MRAQAWLLAGITLLTLMVGCAPSPPENSKPDNTADVCASVITITMPKPDSDYAKKLQEAYSGSDPAARAAADKARAEMFAQWAAKLEPLAQQATNAEVRSAIEAMASDLKQGGTQLAEHGKRLGKLCPLPSATP